MRIRDQLTALVLVMGGLGIGALLIDRMIAAGEVLEHRTEIRASAISETVEALVQDDVVAGRWNDARKKVQSMARLPGVIDLRVFDKTGKPVINEASPYRPGAGGTDGPGIEVHSAMVDQDSHAVVGGVQVALRRPATWKNLRPLLLRGIGVAILAMLALAVAARLLGRLLARRLEALADAVSRADNLDLMMLPDGGANSELDRLSRSFNSLHARLHDEARHRARLEAAKTDLTNMLVHDMKHPLTVIRAVLSCIDEWEPSQLPAERRINLIRMADKAISREDGMIDDLLQVARLQNEEMPARLRPIPLSEFLAECAQTNCAIVENAGRTWRLELAEEARSRTVLGDRIVLRRLIGNLVLNAVEHSPAGTTVTLSVRVRDEKGRWIELAVRDEGPGVPADRRDAIFRKYATFAESAKNVGLGLAFCKLAATRHCGRLILSTEPGKGTTFSLLLPLHGRDAWVTTAKGARVGK
ncbi:MAG: HAMP domain-containing histidine kinase [Elusimicrobia bacterium]|nr:HAMP domain-containing histidine kinase [Elusimicrobiota bacterium]